MSIVARSISSPSIGGGAAGRAVVVQGDRTGVLDPSEYIRSEISWSAMKPRVFAALELLELALLEELTALVLEELPVIRDERVHAVHRDELLGDLEARAVLLLRRAHDAAEISESPRRPKESFTCWPSRPDQLMFIEAQSAVLFTIPGVHSTVWIFAMSAALMSQAVSNRRWSSSPGSPS
jgi:hypothetical protein